MEDPYRESLEEILIFRISSLKEKKRDAGKN
jgi:hypothetical protein